MRNEHEIIRLRKDSYILHNTDNLDVQHNRASTGAGTSVYSQGVAHLFVILINQVLIYDDLVIF